MMHLQFLIFYARTIISSYFYLNFKNSPIGPSDKAGKKLSAPTIITTAISQKMNRGVYVGSVPDVTGTFFFLTRLPATASIGICNQNRPMNMQMLSIILMKVFEP